MVRAIDIVSKVLREYTVKAAESHKAKQVRDKKQWEGCRRLVDEVKVNFKNILETELRKKLNENPLVSNRNMHINVMPIHDAVIEEHIRLSGENNYSSKIPMLQELVDLAKDEGLEPFIFYWNSGRYNAIFQVIISEDLIQKVLEDQA